MDWVQKAKLEATKPKTTKPKRSYFPVRVDPELLARFDAVAKDYGISRNRLVEVCLITFVANIYKSKLKP